jgi:hypothetical protein
MLCNLCNLCYCDEGMGRLRGVIQGLGAWGMGSGVGCVVALFVGFSDRRIL